MLVYDVTDAFSFEKITSYAKELESVSLYLFCTLNTSIYVQLRVEIMSSLSTSCLSWGVI